MTFGIFLIWSPSVATSFAALGMTRLFAVLAEHAGNVLVTGYADTNTWFSIADEDAMQVKLYLKFDAQTRAQVKAFWAPEAKAGGRDNGGPGCGSDILVLSAAPTFEQARAQ